MANLISTNNLSDVDSVAAARSNLRVSTVVANRSALKALDVTKDVAVYLTEMGREGVFVWRPGDYSALISADPLEGVYLKANSTASASGAWVRQLDQGELHVTWFGASTSLADNAPFFQAAAKLSNTASIRVPTGDFKFTQPVTYESKQVRWQGNGRDISRLIWTTAVDGFQIGTVTPVEHVEIFDLSFISDATSSTTAAIDARFTSNIRPACTFERLIISGTFTPSVQGLKWWGFGIKTTNAMNPTFRDIVGRGATGATVPDVARADSLIFCTATVASVVMIFDNIFTINFGSCIKIRSASSPSMEGIYMDRINAVFANTGIDIVFNSGAYHPPQMYLHNSQFECFYRNVDIRGASEVDIGGNLFYFTNFGNSGPNSVYLENCLGGRFYSNSLYNRPTNTTVEGIRLQDCDSVQVFNNTISALAAQVVFAGSTRRSSEYNNRIDGSGAAFVDTSSAAATNKGGKVLAATGYQWVGDVLDQWGTAAGQTDSNGILNVNFASWGGRAFPNQIFQLVATNGDHAAGSEAVSVNNLTVNGFTVKFQGAPSQPRRVNYIAKGR
ncbi:hypothetical protein [Phyllobacterium myrsinacearum]|uniref:Putative tail fiber protein gp53-like C-terminal domain-containing protein n=1 Tax=Phyllobacterium myrsinacearum TaxID=28101 RepID=A0A839EM28_9HYPH|nr:hypothetical protein [Phyllobacterium myrsinacearum]MBA8881101.1 hypothetical protein [Phyllobacterium myrsinacearum]